MQHHFKAKIYQIGINWAVDVPSEISMAMTPERGYIRIKGLINDFAFIQTLVPVKNGPYRLFVNFMMMKGGKTALGEIAAFSIEQNDTALVKLYPMSKLLADKLAEHQLNDAFNQLSESRKKDILKYLSFIKTDEALQRNIEKVIVQLQQQQKDIRIP